MGKAIRDGETGGHAKPSSSQVQKSIAAWVDGHGVSPHPAKLVEAADSLANGCIMAVVAALASLAVAKALRLV